MSIPNSFRITLINFEFSFMSSTFTEISAWEELTCYTHFYEFNTVIIITGKSAFKHTSYFSVGNTSLTFKCGTKQEKISARPAGAGMEIRKNQVTDEFMQHVYGGMESNREHEHS